MSLRLRCSAPGCGHSFTPESAKPGEIVPCPRCGQNVPLPPINSDSPMKSPSEPGEAIPGRIGRFEIRAQVGGGAFGVVYKAFDPVLQREVALKVARPETLDDPKARARFLREPKAAAQLQHPSIVLVFDAGSDGDTYYIASAFIEGHTLGDLIAEKRPQTRLAAEWVRQLAEALHYAHGLGVIHRDVKPGNVLIDVPGRPLLTDFGLARLAEGEEKLTQEGAVLGTPSYMAPEQADPARGKVGPASDQYSLGVVLYELLCGQTPFAGPANVVIYNLLNQEPDPPRNVVPGIPKDLETICLKAMAKDPKGRYPDCGALAEDLRRWLADEPIRARRQGPVERLARWARKNRALSRIYLALAGLVLLGIVFGVGSLLVLVERDLAIMERWEAEAGRREAEKGIEEAELAQRGAEESLKMAEDTLEDVRDRLDKAGQELKKAQTAEAKATAQKKEAEIKVELKEAEQRQTEALRRLAEAVLVLQKAEIKLEEIVKGPSEIEKIRSPGLIVPRGGPVVPGALVTKPAPLAGLRGWTLEARQPRGPIRVLAGGPGGKMVATAGDDEAIRLWDPATRRVRTILVGHRGTIRALAFSWDGRILASGGLDRTVRLWEPVSGQLLRSFPDYGGGIQALAWSPDGRYLAVGRADGHVAVWNLKKGKQDRLLQGPDPRPVEALAWSPLGDNLAGTGPGGATIIWNPWTGQQVNHYKKAATLIAWSPDGSRLAAADGKSLDIWNALKGTPEESLPEVKVRHNSGGFGWDPSGKALAVYSGSGIPEVWDLDPVGKANKRPKPEKFQPAENSIAGLVFGGEPLTVLTQADEFTFLWREFSSGKELLKFRCRPALTTLGWSPNGTQLVLGTVERDTSFHDTRSGERVFHLSGVWSFESLFWAPDGSKVLWGPRVIDPHNKASWAVNRSPELTRGPGSWKPEGGALWLASDKDGNKSIVRSEKVEPKDKTQVVFPVPREENPYPLLSPDGRLLALCKPQEIGLYEPSSGKQLHTLIGPRYYQEGLTGVCWSGNSKFLAGRVGEGEVIIWQGDDGQLLSRLIPPTIPDARPGPYTPIKDQHTFTFLADGHTLAVSNADDAIRYWDVVTGRLVRTLHGIPWGILSSGARFCASPNNTAAGLWDLDTRQHFGNLVLFDDGEWVVVSPEGHFRGTQGAAREMVHVLVTDDGQKTLTPLEFQEQYRWRNDPTKARLLAD